MIILYSESPRSQSVFMSGLFVSIMETTLKISFVCFSLTLPWITMVIASGCDWEIRADQGNLILCCFKGERKEFCLPRCGWEPVRRVRRMSLTDCLKEVKIRHGAEDGFHSCFVLCSNETLCFLPLVVNSFIGHKSNLILHWKEGS